MTTYKTFSNRNRPRPEKLIYDAVPASPVQIREIAGKKHLPVVQPRRA